jgi:hypothetical protein
MSLCHIPTIDELLGDSLVQAVMRADNVEPQTLRILLADAAARVEQRQANALLTKPPIDRRPTSRAANAPARVRPAPLADPCGSALCC